jgi:predicted amidophosphoribosyltransferase
LTARKTVWEVLEERRPILGTVPPVYQSFVCSRCLGPVSGFAHCFGCNKLFASAPHELRGAVVPMTSVVKPSPWYSLLAGYKTSAPQYMPPLAAVAYAFITAHEAEITGLLGGESDLLTIVPSTRGIPYDQQPLCSTLALTTAIRERLVQTMSYVSGQSIGRQEYKPTVFKPIKGTIKGKRVVLVEDTWVSGSRALSAAGALMEAGASGVAVLPIARVLDDGFWPSDHPYRTAMQQGYDHRAWPR